MTTPVIRESEAKGKRTSTSVVKEEAGNAFTDSEVDHAGQKRKRMKKNAGKACVYCRRR